MHSTICSGNAAQLRRKPFAKLLLHEYVEEDILPDDESPVGEFDGKR